MYHVRVKRKNVESRPTHLPISLALAHVQLIGAQCIRSMAHGSVYSTCLVWVSFGDTMCVLFLNFYDTYPTCNIWRESPNYTNREVKDGFREFPQILCTQLGELMFVCRVVKFHEVKLARWCTMWPKRVADLCRRNLGTFSGVCMWISVHSCESCYPVTQRIIK